MPWARTQILEFACVDTEVYEQVALTNSVLYNFNRNQQTRDSIFRP
jgi:hypothetical protein